MNTRGRQPWRRVDGIVLLDKPAGLSSNQALQKLRRIFRAEKAGHTGALDPLATGLLPICLGEATKIAGLMLAQAKAYRTRIQLGWETTTDDAAGEALDTPVPVPNLSPDDVKALLPRFVGRIQQVPPRYSALKRDGVPLYRRARRGEDFEVPAREVEVHRIDWLDQGPDWLELEVECGSGTYIRSLARDIGAALGCGGHVASLRRLWVEPFRSPCMYSLEDLQALAARGDTTLFQTLLPIASGLTDWRQLVLSPDQIVCLRHGQTLNVDEHPGEVLVLDASGEAVALGEVDGMGVLRSRRQFLPPVAPLT